MQTKEVSTKTKLTQFIRIRRVLDLTQLGRTTLWRLVKEGQFPKPVRIGPNSIAWRELDYEVWADNPGEWRRQN